ncbi:hypothetical protein V0288_06590 [Pannus brasiliensis CCIBt3594]|uniref:Uncharacterized protein n=1 Tax=Pannus brasiliensis CCIBt3594 TaxID=1427578 RepID=A0AAW9QI81_9CHRO
MTLSILSALLGLRYFKILSLAQGLILQCKPPMRFPATGQRRQEAGGRTQESGVRSQESGGKNTITISLSPHLPTQNFSLSRPACNPLISGRRFPVHSSGFFILVSSASICFCPSRFLN